MSGKPTTTFDKPLTKFIVKQEIYVESSENQTKKWRKDNICSKDG